MKQKTIVYVVNKKGKPLMPTTRCGHVRKLLKEKKAVPISNNPFTIRLKYETPDVVQPLYLGVDTGRENIGLAVSDEEGNCLYLAELKTNNKTIKKNMEERRQFRSERRRHKRIRKQRKAMKNKTTIQNGEDDVLRTKKQCKSKKIKYPGMKDGTITHKVIQGAEAQFNNRKRKEGWLTPSGNQLIQMHMNTITSVMKILPISHITIERVSFDFQKLENEDINKWEYGKGPLYGFKDYKAYINEEQHGVCLLCGKNPIEYYHHIVQKKDNGSDNVKNIAGLCKACHYGKDGVHHNPDAVEQLKSLKEGLKQNYSISLLNSVMPVLLETLFSFCKENNLTLAVTDGKTTYDLRNTLTLPKFHCVDAYCISLTGRKDFSISLMPAYIYHYQRFKKKSKNIIHKRNSREYYVKELKDNKEVLTLVAKNRHKATDQDFPSLEDYIEDYRITHTEVETNHHLSSLLVKPCRRTYTYHKKDLKSPFHAGDLVKYEKHNKINGKLKQDIFVISGLDYSNQIICIGTKKRKFKYCSYLQGSCIPCISKTTLSL